MQWTEESILSPFLWGRGLSFRIYSTSKIDDIYDMYLAWLSLVISVRDVRDEYCHIHFEFIWTLDTTTNTGSGIGSF